MIALLKNIRWIGLAAIVALFSACASHNQLAIDDYSQDQEAADEQFADRAKDGGSESGSEVEVLPFGGEMGSADGLLDDEMIDYVPIIYFGYDNETVDELGQKTLRFYAGQMLDNPDLEVVLEGHTDERGTPSYNLALGERRAKSVEEALILFGVSIDRITTISFGEEAPVAYGHDEDSWSKNRRVELKF